MSSEHGTKSRYVHDGCRCVPCTEANRDAIARKNRDRRAQTAANGGIAPIDPHGTASTYGNWGCRCDPCTRANAEASVRQRARNALAKK